MYKYTPRADIMHGWKSARAKPFVVDREYKFIRATLAAYDMTEYRHYTAFWRQYETVQYYSPRRATAGVPLDGYLFPIEMFTEEQV